MWKSKNKTDLMIEVWEKLDCESVGAREIESIETVVGDVFGKAAVDSPMIIARLLADEGAELRHSEVMELYIKRASDRPYDAPLRNLLDTTNFASTLKSIRQIENLRRKFAADGDRDGMRLLRQHVIDEKNRLGSKRVVRPESKEIAGWLTLWLQSPELFEGWISLRKRSEEFVLQFGDIGD
jgi:hypothetical protein